MLKNSKIAYILTIIFFISFLAIIYQNQLTRLYDRLLKLGNKMFSLIFLVSSTYFDFLEEFQERHALTQTELYSEGTDNLVVLYNRVPKTGSTSFVGIAYDLCKQNNFRVLHVNITANSNLLTLENQVKFVTNVTKWDVMRPALFHGHFAFLDFSKFGLPKPLFINLIRRPLDRFVSYYYFVRYGDNFRPYLVRKKHGNTMVICFINKIEQVYANLSFQTFDECVNKRLAECDPSHMWLQIPYFCGHSANCWKPGNKWALQEAKKNLVTNYFLVGVTEELEDFIVILERSLPRMFKGATEHFLNSNRSHLRKTVQKEVPSEETMQKIKKSVVWQMENELYEFALEQFHFTKKQFLKNKNQNVMYEKIRPKT
ncbi:unnamed protein product [Acanthoscelides obtectus]|uniref:Heparin sulfate O-sulfotransferase n=1 Tax=Acanthoscelides obtectus TaxID=200917 RepID=A0A9P0JNZ7_ACAOB|nr:unnamed protein product [Acanthoscelides obtectus]CAK1673633.1 Heparin sulfate O-sulfotransferase [Acanthoscelides obtectus]